MTRALDIDFSTAKGTPATHITEARFETRQEAARRACEEVGIVWPQTILPPGTALYTSGLDVLKADRARWAKLPDAHTGVRVIKAALAAEQREDFVVPVKTLGLNSSNARLGARESGANAALASGAGYDAHAFRQLVAQTPGFGAGEAPRSFAGALLHLDADERAAVMNRRLPAAKSNITLRTKMSHNGQRIVRAMLSEKYGDLNDIHVGEALEHALGDGLSREARLDYKPGDKQSRFEVFFPSQVAINTFVVGDVHYAGLIVENSETGEGACNVRAFLMRAACANMTLAPGLGVSIRHIGKSERLLGSLKAAVTSALNQIDPLIAVIQKSASEQLTDITARSPSDILRSLAKKYEVKADRAQSWVTTFEAKYADTPASTYTLTAAITDAAQSNGWWGDTAVEEEIAANVMQTGVRKALGF